MVIGQKKTCAVLHTPKHYGSFLGVWFITCMKLFRRVTACNVFNIHFSVLTNFVMFVYLDVFLELNFIARNICLFIQLLSCVIIFTRRFKGHLEISASASRYQHWNWHRYQHYKNFICFVQLFFQKVEHLCPIMHDPIHLNIPNIIFCT